MHATLERPGLGTLPEPEPEHDPTEDGTTFDPDEQNEEGHEEDSMARRLPLLGPVDTLLVPVCPHCGRVRCICPPR